MNDFERKQQAKRERLGAAAKKQAAIAQDASKREHAIIDHIPMGQPILVGHHSERRHRRDLDRAGKLRDKAIEASDRAADLAHRAETYGTHGISSDDPEAITKLRAQLAEALVWRESAVFWNKKIRQAGTRAKAVLGHEPKAGDFATLIDASEDMPAPIREGLLRQLRAFPQFVPPQIENGAQRQVAYLKGRIAELEKALVTPARTSTFGTLIAAGTTASSGFEILDNPPANRIQIKFQSKPSKARMSALKSAGFRWAPSEGAWQRQRSNGAWYDAHRTLGALDQLKSEEPIEQPHDWQPTATWFSCSRCGQEAPAPHAGAADEGSCRPVKNCACLTDGFCDVSHNPATCLCERCQGKEIEL